MCLKPVYIYDSEGSSVEVACRKCKRCVANLMTSRAGQAYAESLVSDHVLAVTLTYADSNSTQSQVLQYDDIQNFLKKLRKKYNVRYLCAGEYGSKRGRAHWHILLFFRGAKPSHPPFEMQQQTWTRPNDRFGRKVEPYWPHGFAFFQAPNYMGLLYVLKYIQKDNGSDRSDRRVMGSQFPPLGTDYWPILAAAQIKAGLPFRRQYNLPDATYKNGNRVDFFLKGRSLVLAYAAYRSEWLKAGNRSEPPIFSGDADTHGENTEKRFILKRIIGTPSCSISECSRYSELRAFALEVESVAFVRNAQPVLTVPDGYVYKSSIGHLVAVTFNRGRVTKWRVEGLADLIGIARGRGYPIPLG